MGGSGSVLPLEGGMDENTVTAPSSPCTSVRVLGQNRPCACFHWLVTSPTCTPPSHDTGHVTWPSTSTMADADGVKALSGLLSGIAQKAYYGNSDITEDLLKSEIYPDMSQEEFHALHEKMRGVLKSIATADMDQTQLEAFLTAQTRKQGGGGVSSEQAAALGRFWKAHRVRIRESLLAQSRWEPGLRSMNWRVDLQTASSRGSTSNTPVALVELELGRNGQDSEFVCLEFDELKVNQVLKKMAEIQEGIDSIVHHS